MRGVLFPFFLLTLILSCSKPGKENDAWLTQKKAGLSECTCLTAIFKGNYQDETIFEIRVIDPLCNGIDIVYRADGTAILDSGDQPSYQNYLVRVKSLEKIWTCK